MVMVVNENHIADDRKKVRLIDANNVEFTLQAICDRESGVPLVLAEWLAGVVRTAPTVDAVEVVRCKDCKYYDDSEGINWCAINSKFLPGGVDWHSYPESGYCSYGERKANDPT